MPIIHIWVPERTRLVLLAIQSQSLRSASPLIRSPLSTKWHCLTWKNRTECGKTKVIWFLDQTWGIESPDSPQKCWDSRGQCLHMLVASSHPPADGKGSSLMFSCPHDKWLEQKRGTNSILEGLLFGHEAENKWEHTQYPQAVAFSQIQQRKRQKSQLSRTWACHFAVQGRLKIASDWSAAWDLGAKKSVRTGALPRGSAPTPSPARLTAFIFCFNESWSSNNTYFNVNVSSTPTS